MANKNVFVSAIDAEQSENTSLKCDEYGSCQHLDVACPQGADCDVICSGEKSCSFLSVSGSHVSINANGLHSLSSSFIDCDVGTKLNINANGPRSLEDARIICPRDKLPGPKQYSNDGSCQIISNGNDSIKSLIIQSTDSQNPPCSSVYKENSGPNLICGLNVINTENFCYFQPLVGTNNKWRCIKDNHVCDDLSTSLPTQSPTIFPTYSRNDEPPFTLYVSASNGCDHGFCQTNNFEKTEFCKYEQNVCCDDISVPSTTAINFDTSACNEDNTVTISNYSVFGNDVIGNVHDEYDPSEGFKVACFKIAVDCWQPVVKKIMFEQIDYNNKYMRVAYKFMENSITQNCTGSSENCDVFNQCPVNDVGLQEMLWNDDPNEPIPFFIINGADVGAYCGETERSMNARIEVQCNRLQTECQSLNYAWNCLQKKDFECEDSQYDGNGKIVMDEGKYSMQAVIFETENYIILQGSGKRKTMLHQMFVDSELINCTVFCHLIIRNLSYFINETSSIVVKSGGFARFENVHFQNNVALNFIISGNASIEFLDCSFISSPIYWEISNYANVHFDDCLFDNLAIGSNRSSLLRIAEKSKVTITNSKFANIHNDLIWQSSDSFGKILNISNDCNGVCFEHANGNLFIDYQSAHNKSVKFGSSTGNMLQALNFDPATIYTDINFVNNSAKVIFEPCTRFDSSFEYVEETLFDQSLSVKHLNNITAIKDENILNAIHDFRFSAEFLRKHLHCNDTDLCYVKCSQGSLVCPLSTFKSNVSKSAFFQCSSDSACLQSRIDVSNAESVAILCDQVATCSEMVITANNISDFVLECIQKESCKGIMVNIRETNNAQIHCYGKHSCDGLRVYSDKNEIKINIHSFSNDIVINVPTDYLQQSLECNPDNAYLRLDGDSFNGLKQTTKHLFDGNMPCEDVKFAFSAIDRVDCHVQYQHFSNSIIDERLTHLRDEMECFPAIYINDLTNYTCFGTDAPTQSPTSSPTTFCPILDVNVNDNFGGFEQYFDGLFVYDGIENEMPYWSVSDKNVKYIDTNKWRINGTEKNHFIDINDDKFLQHIASITPMTGTYSFNNNSYSITIKCILTAAPTNAPSLSPTLSPSRSPTNSPTNAPSFSPSLAPSNTPTAPPSRAPTSLSEYDSFMNFNYLIGGMSYEDVSILAERNGKYKFNQTINIDIVNMIESAYVNLDWTLHFKEFYVRIESVNDLSISYLTNKERPDIPLTDDCSNNVCSLTLKSKMFCTTTICDYIFDKFATQKTNFATAMTVKFIDYLYPTADSSKYDKIWFAVQSIEAPRLLNPLITKWSSKIENWIIIFVGIVFMIIIFAVFYFKHRIKKMRNKKAFVVSNPMVLLISIGKYVNNQCNNDIDVHIDDLPGIENDILHMTELFGKGFGYDVYPKTHKNEPLIEWKEGDLKKFIEDKARYLGDNIDVGMKYDGLILVISCHGIPDYLLTSDYRKYSKLAVQRTFSFLPKMREIPRFILFDCCSGHQGRKSTIRDLKLTDEEKEEMQTKGVEEADIFDGASNHELWIDDDQNPDHKIARVNAANAGFTSNLNTQTGSHLIYKMFNKYMDALDGKRTPFPFIHEVFDEIQTELQEAGLQLPESVWNDGTRYLLFKKRVGPKHIHGSAKSLSVDIVYNEQSGGPRTNELEMAIDEGLSNDTLKQI